MNRADRRNMMKKMGSKNVEQMKEIQERVEQKVINQKVNEKLDALLVLLEIAMKNVLSKRIKNKTEVKYIIHEVGDEIERVANDEKELSRIRKMYSSNNRK